MKNTQKSLPKPIDDLRKSRYWPKNIPMPKAGAYSGGSRWTHEEERLLKRYYPLYGGRYCARLLGRSTAGIRMHARHLHLNSDSRFWSEEDIARLKREYGTMPNAKLART